MTAAINTAILLLAQSDGAGRGGNPSEEGGILIIVGAIVLAVATILAAGYLVARTTAKRRGGAKGRPGREG